MAKHYLSSKAFYNVHSRLKVVLSCIVQDKGDNSLVESKRGKLFRDATLIDLTAEDKEEAESSVNFADLDELDDTVED